MKLNRHSVGSRRTVGTEIQARIWHPQNLSDCTRRTSYTLAPPRSPFATVLEQVHRNGNNQCANYKSQWSGMVTGLRPGHCPNSARNKCFFQAVGYNSGEEADNMGVKILLARIEGAQTYFSCKRCGVACHSLVVVEFAISNISGQ